MDFYKKTSKRTEKTSVGFVLGALFLGFWILSLFGYIAEAKDLTDEVMTSGQYIADIAPADSSLTLALQAPVFYEDNSFPYGENLTPTNSLNKIGTDLPKTISSGDDIYALILNVFNFLLSFYVIVAVFILMYHGVRIMLSRGSDERRKTALKAIWNIVIATAIIMLSYVIVFFIVRFFQNPTELRIN